MTEQVPRTNATDTITKEANPNTDDDPIRQIANEISDLSLATTRVDDIDHEDLDSSSVYDHNGASEDDDDFKIPDEDFDGMFKKPQSTDDDEETSDQELEDGEWADEDSADAESDCELNPGVTGDAFKLTVNKYFIGRKYDDLGKATAWSQKLILERPFSRLPRHVQLFLKSLTRHEVRIVAECLGFQVFDFWGLPPELRAIILELVFGTRGKIRPRTEGAHELAEPRLKGLPLLSVNKRFRAEAMQTFRGLKTVVMNFEWSKARSLDFTSTYNHDQTIRNGFMHFSKIDLTFELSEWYISSATNSSTAIPGLFRSIYQEMDHVVTKTPELQPETVNISITFVTRIFGDKLLQERTDQELDVLHPLQNFHQTNSLGHDTKYRLGFLRAQLRHVARTIRDMKKEFSRLGHVTISTNLDAMLASFDDDDDNHDTAKHAKYFRVDDLVVNYKDSTQEVMGAVVFHKENPYFLQVKNLIYNETSRVRHW